jgi:hypothetical protein
VSKPDRHRFPTRVDSCRVDLTAAPARCDGTPDASLTASRSM